MLGDKRSRNLLMVLLQQIYSFEIAFNCRRTKRLWHRTIHFFSILHIAIRLLDLGLTKPYHQVAKSQAIIGVDFLLYVYYI